MIRTLYLSICTRLTREVTLKERAPATPVKNVAVRLLTRFVPDWLWQPAAEEPAGIRLISTGMRVVEPLKLGEDVVVPIGEEGQQRVEMTVSEAMVTRSMSDDLVDRLFGGSLTDAVSHLREYREVSRQELNRLEELIRQRKKSR